MPIEHERLKGKKLIIFDLDHTIGKLDVNWTTVSNELHDMFASNYGVNEDFSHISTALTRSLNAAKQHQEQARAAANAICLAHEMKNIANFTPDLKVVAYINHSSDKKIAIVSGNQTPTIKQALGIAGVEQKVDMVVGRDSVPDSKPNPEGILRAINEAEVEKHEAIMVGDSRDDKEACHRAGIEFLHVDKLHNI